MLQRNTEPAAASLWQEDAMPDVGPSSPPSASDLIARVAEARLLVVTGGVAANQPIRAALDGVAWRGKPACRSQHLRSGSARTTR